MWYLRATSRGSASSLLHAARLLSLALLAACGAPGASEPSSDAGVSLPDSASPAAVDLTIGGREVDCARPSYLGVAGSALVRLRAARGEGEGLDLLFDGAPLRAERRDGELAATVALFAEPRALTVERDGRELCRVHVRSEDADAAARERLLAASEGPTRVTRSSRTGNASNLTGTFTLPPAATRRDAVEAFAREQASAFGALASQLVWEQQWDSPDGWQTHRLGQALGGRSVLGAALDVVVDDGGRVRGLHSTLLPALTAAPAVTRSSEEVRAAVDATAPPRAVLYTELSTLGSGSPTLRAGWEAQTASETLLVDDATGEVRLRTEREIGARLDAISPVDLGLAISGDTSDPPRICVPTDPADAVCDFHATSGERTVWQHYAAILRWTEWRGYPGWVPRAYDCDEECAPGVECECLPHEGPDHFKFIVQSVPSIGAYSVAPVALMLIDVDAVDEVDLICHEHAHGIDLGLNGRYANPRTTLEAAADVFAIGCERAVEPGRDPWVMFEGYARTRDVRQAARAGVDYETLVPASERDLSENAAYDATFVMTAALHLAVESYGWGLDRGHEAFAYESLVWQRPDYLTWRDRWLATAALWAEEGRHGVTEEDVCAMARGFRDTGLHRIPSDQGPGDEAWEDVCDDASAGDACWCQEESRTRCSDATSCAECNDSVFPGCGWCPGMGCLPDELSGSCDTDWIGNETACSPCDGFSDCESCALDPFCGWCPGTGCVAERSPAAASCSDFQPLAGDCSP